MWTKYPWYLLPALGRKKKNLLIPLQRDAKGSSRIFCSVQMGGQLITLTLIRYYPFLRFLRCLIHHCLSMYCPVGSTDAHTLSAQAHKGFARQYITSWLIRNPSETHFLPSSCIQIHPALFGETWHSLQFHFCYG